MANAPSTDNYVLGKGVIFFNELLNNVYQGERDLGNAPTFSMNIALDKVEHFSSRGGLGKKDKSVISKVTPGIAFSLDEINMDNFSMLALGDVSSVAQAASVISAEAAVVHVGLRGELAKRNLGMLYAIPFENGTVIAVPGEIVTGSITGATATVVYVDGTVATGTIYGYMSAPTVPFTQDDVLTGSIAAAAEVLGSTAGVVASTSYGYAVVTDATGTTVQAANDAQFDATLKDAVIGRIKWSDTPVDVADGESVLVNYYALAITYDVISAFTKTVVEGFLRFVSDNAAGAQKELKIWRVSITPTGDTAMIGENWSTLGFQGEVLSDMTNHPDSPYMDIIKLT